MSEISIAGKPYTLFELSVNIQNHLVRIHGKPTRTTTRHITEYNVKLLVDKLTDFDMTPVDNPDGVIVQCALDTMQINGQFQIKDVNISRDMSGVIIELLLSSVKYNQ